MDLNHYPFDELQKKRGCPKSIGQPLFILKHSDTYRTRFSYKRFSVRRLDFSDTLIFFYANLKTKVKKHPFELHFIE